MKPQERHILFSVTAQDCRWDYYRGSGKGGQKRNKTSNAVRCTHSESGAVGQAEDERSQRQNKKLAFKRMAESKKFKTWLKLEYSRRIGREAEIQNEVERAMMPHNLKIETKNEDNKWIEMK
jgi:protein subunit release factor B